MTKAIEESEDYDVWWLIGDLFIERTRNGQMGSGGFASFIGSLVGGFFWVSGFSEPVVFFSNFGGVASFSVRLHGRWLHQTSSQQTMDTGD